MRKSFIIFILIVGIVGCQNKLNSIEDYSMVEMNQNELLNEKVTDLEAFLQENWDRISE